MNFLGPRLRRALATVPAPVWPILTIIVAVLLGNVMYVTGLTIYDPVTWTANISKELCHITCGRPAIDPNVGFITQPLGHLAAMDLLHGHLPLWNPFEGLGSPLAGEMQSAALFPLTLLFALPAGLLWFHLLLEMTAGICTYLLLRRLGVRDLVGAMAGSMFALNGTYAWIGNAALNPVALLPVVLLGVEMTLDAVREHRPNGWYVLAVGLALSLYAGFPETAYLDGLLALGWMIVRVYSLERARRLAALARVSVGAAVGALLAAPIMVPFLDFLKQATVGGHVATADGVGHIAGTAYPMLLDPYVFSTIFSNPAVGNAWGGIGGYFGASVVVLALVGLIGERLRPLRIYLGAWMVLGMALMDNFEGIRRIWNLLPKMETVSVPRYIFPSLEMALVVLAALGVADLLESRRARWALPVAGAVVLGIEFIALSAAAKYNAGILVSGKRQIILMGLHALPFIAIGLLVALGVVLALTRWRGTVWLIALVAVGEAVTYFFVPSAEAPKQITVDQAPIAFLQSHQGLQRFLDFAVLYPNWGTQYGLHELSQVDLPFPQAYADYLNSTLYPGLSPANQFTVHGGMTGIMTQQQVVADHFKAYEDASVRYLVMPQQAPLLPALSKLGVKQVFLDWKVAIYQMPHTRGFFSSSNRACTVTPSSLEQVSVTCPAGASTTLLRTELMMPGWHAYVNGQEVPITTVDGVYQSISVPAGTSSVRYAFRSPHMTFALSAFLLGVLFSIATWIVTRRRRPGRHARSDQAGGPSPPEDGVFARSSAPAPSSEPS